MSFETIVVRRVEGTEDAVCLITLNRPEVRNAINQQMIRDLSKALDQLAADPVARALVITGAGDKAFAAGADIAELKERGVREALARINASLFRRLEEHPLPSIAAIAGFALGGGCELAMACDLRIAAEGAKLGQPEVGLGIIPGAGAIQRLPRLVGLGLAKEMIFTGKVLDADEAARIGLVNRVVPAHRLMEEALAVARQIAAQGPLAVRLAKLALNSAGGTSLAYDALECAAQAITFESEDKHRRMGEFLERRQKKS